jgi:type IV pilus assembly protein PilY1
LASLSYRRGGIPLFDHKFLVNATARAWDVDFNNTNTSTPPATNDWHSVLIGGLGAGGRSVYALDITTPVGPTESETDIANSRVLWEFTDANLGYIYDPPTIVKTFAYGWVVLVPSGYNNPGGKGFLYVLNPTNGAILRKLPLPGDTGTDAAPTGLSTIRAFTASRRDPLALQAYGGDLKGNVWRFDLSDANPANWSAATALIAKLKDGNNNEQPITTGVRIEIDQTNNVDRYLFVGTGKLLGPADITSNTVRNSLYVIRDGTRTTPEPAPATPYGRSNLNSVNGSVVAGFSGTPTGRGWYQDAADLTEKIGTDVFADVQTVVFAFSKPTSDPCAAPLSSRLFARDFTSGASVLVANGGVVPGYDISSGIAGVQLIQGQPGSGGTSSGEIRALVTTMKGEVFSFALTPPATPAARHRVSWRLLNKN